MKIMQFRDFSAAAFASLALAVSLPLAAQEAPNIFEKAPPDVDAALRARVTQFYQYEIEGKFRAADQLVAEDAKDAYFEAEKVRFKTCDIVKITYSENFTKANVLNSCKADFFFHGIKTLATRPISSLWKIQNGEWFWYTVPVTEVETPFGKMKAGPETGNGGGPVIPGNPAAMAQDILKAVKIDRTSFEINSAQSSRQEFHVKNGMPGGIQLSVDAPGVPGLTIKPVKTELGAGEETAVVVDYNLNSPDVQCKECLSHPQERAPVTVNLHVLPSGQTFPIQITFARLHPKQ